MTAKEPVSEVNIVQGRSTEGDEAILGAFFCEPLRMKLQDVQQVPWIAD